MDLYPQLTEFINSVYSSCDEMDKLGTGVGVFGLSSVSTRDVLKYELWEFLVYLLCGERVTDSDAMLFNGILQINATPDEYMQEIDYNWTYDPDTSVSLKAFCYTNIYCNKRLKKKNKSGVILYINLFEGFGEFTISHHSGPVSKARYETVMKNMRRHFRKNL
ncbi:MAG: hypothetical protein IK097_05795 [Clostridia bacterium]|nr:hypothetical protein [Clostridia bacterium]